MVWNAYYAGQIIGLTSSTDPGATWYDYISTGNWQLIYLNSATSSTDPNYVRVPPDTYAGNPAPVVTGQEWFIFSIGYTAGTTTITNYAVNGSARTANAVTAQTGTNTGVYFINGLPPNPYDTSQVGEILHYNTSLNNSERQQVESYLARKWGLTSLLPSTHPGKLLPSFSSVFTPKSLTGLQLWLDAADSSTITGTSTVTAWADKSGNGYNMNTLSAAPNGYSQVYPTTGTPINGLNTVNFLPGTGLQQATILDGVKNLYWVGRIDTTGVVEGGSNCFFLLGHDTAYEWHADFPGGYYIDSTYSQLGIRNATPVSQYGGGAAAAVNITFSALQFPASGSISLVSAAGITGSTLYQGICFDRIGVHCGWSGDLAEVIIFNQALSTTQHQQVEGYLAWKWGLQGNLPDTHAYKKIKP
jgi:hypothetical protein